MNIVQRVIITDIDPGSAADKAEMAKGDLILSYGGVTIDSTDGLIDAIENHWADRNKVTVVVVRGNSPLTLQVETGSLGISMRMLQVDGDSGWGLNLAEDLALNHSAAHGVMITTTPALEGWCVKHTLGVVGAEYMLHQGIFKDMQLDSTVGFRGYSKVLQEAMEEGRRDLLVHLRAEADALGGNAVIGTRIECAEFPVQNKPTLLMHAYGTAVTVQRETSDMAQ